MLRKNRMGHLASLSKRSVELVEDVMIDAVSVSLSRCLLRRLREELDERRTRTFAVGFEVELILTGMLEMSLNM